MTCNMEEHMKDDLKKLSKEELACVRGGTGKTLRRPSSVRTGPVAATLCGGDAMAESCVAIIHIPVKE